MSRSVYILILLLLLISSVTGAVTDTLMFRGQASLFALYNQSRKLPLNSGLRYIPQLNYSLDLKNDHKIDFEASANLAANAGISFFDSISASDMVKAYRLWARYSTRQLELRVGLQKINFGSANILRPLMWFDQVDPRDPLKLTDGVWGALGRYYFLNNANIWLWCLYGNTKPKGWETSGTNRNFPEVGGRLQLPVPSGEIAFTYHFRIADTRNLSESIYQFEKVNENRVGFDIKLNLFTGIWFEGSMVTRNKELGINSTQKIFNAGMDYTFNIGNGIYAVFEQLLAAGGERSLDFQNRISYSLLSLSYPVGISGRLGSISYYDWGNRKAYNFVNWNKQFGNFSFYLIAYWNPDIYNIPSTGESQNYYGGRGIQAMLVLNH